VLRFQLRPGICQVPRQTLRHWPVLTAAVTLLTVIVAVAAVSAPGPARHLKLRIASARDQLAAASFATIATAAPAKPAYDLNVKAQVARTTAAHLTYRVHRGDTLSEIAKAEYGHANRWPALWWVNRHQVRNPAALHKGTVLHLSAWHPDKVWLTRKALAAIPRPVVRHRAATAAPPSQGGASAPVTSSAQPAAVHAGIYSYSQLQALWVSAGGPAGASAQAAQIAMCESGGNPRAYNPSGASGLWQILGNPFPGDPFDPATNARMAVAKYNSAGGSFAPWVCQ